MKRGLRPRNPIPKAPAGGARKDAGRKPAVFKRLENELWSKHEKDIERGVQRLVSLTRHKNADVALAAIKILMDRVWGKARQTVSLDATVDGTPAAVNVSLAAIQMHQAKEQAR